MARPEGAFDPVDPVVDGDDDQADDDADDDDEPEPIVDARVIPRPEAGARPPPRPDGGQVMREDGMVEPPPVDDPRAALAGRYLMRMDMYSELETESSPRIRLRNRVSNLFMVDLAFDGERLVGTEYLCDQIYAHECASSSCRSWSTRVDSSVRQQYFGGMRSIERAYTYEASTGKLTAEQASIALGYDEREGQSGVPTDTADPRLWKASAGPGIYTSFDAMASVLRVSCELSTVQRFTTSFSGMVTEPVSLDGKEFPLTVMTMGGVIGQPTGTPSNQCTRQRFEMQPNPQGEKFIVRFKATDAEACPASFDREFGPMPDFM